MKAYVLSVAGAVILCAVLSIVLPSGKMGKFIRGALKLVVLVVLVSPFVSFLKEGKFSFEEDGFVLESDTDYLENCESLYSAQKEAELNAYLSETYAVVAKTQVTCNVSAGYRPEKIIVSVTDFGINGQDEHINILNRIKSDLSESYGCEVVVS